MWNRIAGLAASTVLSSVVWTCPPPCVPVSPCIEAGRAHAIFVGTVKQVREDLAGSSLVQVERVFKGTVSGAVEVRAVLETGRQYLIYATAESTAGPYSPAMCSRTRLTNEAADDLDFLEPFSANKTPTRVSGVVEFSSADPNEPEFARNQPMGGVRVKLVNAGREQSVITEADGVYAFDRVSPGPSSIQAELKDHIHYWGPEAFEVAAGACHELNLSMGFDRRVSGVVRDSRDEPVKELLVQMFGTNGVIEMGVETDGEGHYEFPNPPAGEYYLGVNIRSSPSSTQPFAAIYYPSGASTREAIGIVIPTGPSQQTFDLQVGHRLPVVRVRVQLVKPDGSAPGKAEQFVVRLHGADRTDLVEPTEIGEGGVFVFDLCAGTQYEAVGFIEGSESSSLQFVASEDRHGPLVLRTVQSSN